MQGNRSQIKEFFNVSHPNFFVFYIVLVLIEIIFRAMSVRPFLGLGIFYIFVFALPSALFFSIVTTAFKPKLRYIAHFIIQTIIILFYISQVVYFEIFGITYTFFSAIKGGGEAIEDFTSTIFTGIADGIIWIILLSLTGIAGMVFLHIIQKCHCDSCDNTRCYVCAKTYKPKPSALLTITGILLLLEFSAFLTLFVGGTEVLSPFDSYMNSDVSNEISVSNLGMATTFRIDIQRNTVGWPDRDEKMVIPVEKTSDNQEPENEYEPNIMDLDFEAMSESTTNEEWKSLDSYFAEAEPTYKNEYTGIYEGYNLIFITAESLSPFAIDKDLTPTLYKMYKEGYQFTNFYDPIWGVSTLDGEYVNLESLIPKSGCWSLSESAENSLPFTLGNQFKSLGYTTQAWHDHTYSYYNRDKSHPKLGYTYKGLGNGLNIRKTWPESDLDMMKATVDSYINKEHFHIYYLTVSGHLEYNFDGNLMARKHRDEVADLPYSDACKAYIACNIEFDLAMEYLLNRLEEAELLDKTVIAICPDHYPYGLKANNISEFTGHDVDTEFEMYKSCFLLYTGSMKEPVKINKLCSAMDVLPTLSNLFGLEYDSRLMMGHDIFSTAEPIVVFQNRNWITEKGKYIASTGKFTAFDKDPKDVDSYVNGLNKEVSSMFTVSDKILTSNYYSHIKSEK